MDKAHQAVALALLAGLLVTAATCGGDENIEAASAARLHGEAPPAIVDTVVLVTIDGVRWQEVFGGVDAGLAERAKLPASSIVSSRELLPSFHRLFFEGGTVLGDPALQGGVHASGPRFVSLPSYVELMAGAPSGCRDNACAPALVQTLADEVAESPGSTDGSVAVFASWELVARAAATDRRRVMVRAGRDPGSRIGAYPGVAGYRPDLATAKVALDYWMAHRPRFLWIALGDTDEWAHRDDYGGYLNALRAADSFVGEIAARLDEMGEHGERSVLIVTTDHGRDADFVEHGGADSGRVWLLARGGPLARRGAIGTALPRYLRDVAPTVRHLLGLSPRTCDGCGVLIDELAASASVPE